ncbi:unnamed protein product [Caenorhabditis brenneri]
MNFIFSFLIIAILSTPGLGVDVTCPTAAITQNTPAGAFPAGGSSIFPANYNCTIQFQIPVGQIVRINITNNLFFDTNDTLTIQDSASTFYSLFVIDKLFYLPATTGKIMISTQTNTSSFYFKWQYIPVTNFNRILNPTGTVLALNLTAGSYYQFTSTRGQLAFHTGSLSGYSDSALAQIYVYDGADLNANYIGNLKVFTDMENVSIGRSLTLVNFYGTSVPSYGIANDYAAISNYDDYDFFVLRSDMDFFRHLISKKGVASAMTLYAISSPETYISTIKFLNPNVTGQEVRVKPATPTENYGNLLTYNVRDFTDGQLPQQILTKTFTVTLSQCDVYIGARSRPSIDWHQAYPGRTGWIYSASLWNPTAVITDLYYTYFNSTNPVKFVFDIQSVKIGKPGEALKVEVGSSTSSSVSVVFNSTVTNTGKKAAHGTFMKTNFTGTSNLSSFAMKFTIEAQFHLPLVTREVTKTVFQYVIMKNLYPLLGR